MKKVLHVLLILVLSGIQMPALNSFSKTECCHNRQVNEEEKSCCTAEMPQHEEKIPACDMFEINSSSFDNCGCVHTDSKIDKALAANKTENLTVVQTSEILFTSVNFDTPNHIKTREFYDATPNEPIFLTNSAFLI